MHIKKRIFLLTALFYILYLLFPLFADIVSIPVWLPSMVTVAVIMALYPNAIANKLFYWFLVYVAVLAVYVLIGREITVGIGTVADSYKIFIEIAWVFPSVLICCVLLYLKDPEVNRRLVNWSTIILYVSFVVAIPLMLRYNSLREALRIEGVETIHIAGLPGYALMHSYTLFLPLMCYATKTLIGWKRIMAFVGLLVLCVVIYDTFITTSLVIALAILFVTFTYKGGNTTVFWLIWGFLLLVMYTLYLFGFFISLIDWMMPAFEGTPVESKLLDFRISMVENEVTGGTIETRMGLHKESWDSFMKNPLLGGGASSVGSHSSLLDRFGGMGFVAGFPFVMIIVSFIRQMVKLYETKTAKMIFWVGIISGLTFMYQKGNWGSEAWLMYIVLVPIGILTLENELLSYGSKTS